MDARSLVFVLAGGNADAVKFLVLLHTSDRFTCLMLQAGLTRGVHVIIQYCRQECEKSWNETPLGGLGYVFIWVRKALTVACTGG
jgi:hypothetical protein